MGRNYLMAGAFVLLAGVAAGGWWLSRPAPQAVPQQPPKAAAALPAPLPDKPVSAAPVSAFRWEAGARQSYRYRLRTQVAVETTAGSGKAAWQTVQADLQGTLNMRVFLRKGEEVYAGFQLSPLALTFNGQRIPQLDAVFQTFFMVEFNPQGQPRRFYFPHYLAEENQRFPREIIDSVQVVLPAVAQGQALPDNWETQEQHNSGEYQARYSRQADGAIGKQKTAYLKLALQQRGDTRPEPVERAGGTISPDLRGQLEKSRWQARLADTASWLKQFGGEEVLEVYTPAGKLARIEYQAELEAVEAVEEPHLGIWTAADDPEQVKLALAEAQGDVSLSSDVIAAIEKQRLREKYAGTSVPQLAGKIAAQSQEGRSMQEMIPALLALEEYLSVYPESALGIPALLREQNLGGRISALLIGSLEHAATPQAQQALAEIIQEPVSTPGAEERSMQALMSGGLVREPGQVLIGALWQSAGQNENREKADTALLALGGAARQAREAGQSALAQQISGELAARLHDGSGTRQQEIALKALGNTGDSSVLPVLEASLKSEDTSVRATAHEILGRFDDAASMTHLLNSVVGDTSPAVRSAAFEAITERTDKVQAVETVRRQLSLEPDDALRAGMLRFLGEYKAANPAVVETLQQQLAQETSREMKKEVYNALYRQ